MIKRSIAAMVAALTAAAWFAASLVSPAAAQDPTGVIASDNVTLIGSIPSPLVIGARFRDGVMYVTSTTGLTTYDISDPANPTELGSLTLPHFENEDVDLGGDILLISNDAAESTGILYVVDIADPAAPKLLSTLPMGGNPLLAGPGHTASCILDCRYAWVSDNSKIRVIDLTDPSAPKDLGKFKTPAGGNLVTHDVQVDGNGLAWVVGFGGAAAYKLPKDYAGPGDEKLLARTNKEGFSTYIQELGTGDGSNYNDYILHNSLRRKNDDVVFITEEDYTRPACKGAGAFETWSLPVNRKGKPTGAELTPLDKWETELVRDNSVRAAACSAHYFDLRRNVVAQGWYEQGLRILDVSDPANIRQIGYFVTPQAQTWAAYFPPTDPTGRIIYVLDASHGIDIIEFDRPAEGPLSEPKVGCGDDCDGFRPAKVRAPVLSEWLSRPTFGLPDSDFGFACRISVD